MSDVHVRLLTLDPVRGTFVPVRGASLELVDDGPIDRSLATAGPTDGDGRAVLQVTEDTSGLSPFFVIGLEGATPVLPAGAPAAHRFSLPESWETLHWGDDRLRGIERHSSREEALEIYAGLPARLDLETPDPHPTGLGNPAPLPEDTLRLHLADSDLCFDDTLTGTGFDRPRNRVADVGEGEEYPYHDHFPTAPHVLDLPAAEASRPRAWVDPPGAPVASLGGGGFRSVGPLAVDHHGFVFLIDGEEVQRFYPDGTWCETVVPPEEAGRGFLPAGLAVDSARNLYAADPGRDRIEVFRLAGELGGSGRYEHRATLGPVLLDTAHPVGTGDPRDHLNRPAHVAVMRSERPDDRELLVVANEGSGRCLVFLLDPEARGILLASGFGEAPADPATPEQIREPGGIAADRHGRVFVSDRALDRITVWRIDREDLTPQAAHRATWPADGGGAFEAPGTLAFGPADGRLYAAEEGRLRRLDPGAPGEEPAAPARAALWTAGDLPSADDALEALHLAADARGELYLADRANRRVVRLSLFDAEGRAIPAAGPPRAVSEWAAGPGGEAFRDPSYVFLSASGRVWVSDTGNDRLVGFDRDPVTGELTREETFSSAPLRAPRGIAEDPDGNLYVADPVRGRIHRIAPDLGDETLLGGEERPFEEPTAVAFLPGDPPRLVVVDRARNELRFQGLDGALGEPIAEADGEAFDAPEDVAADGAGGVYAADTGNRRVVHLDLGQDPPAARSIRPAGAGIGWEEPSGVAVDSEGKLIVTDRGKGRVFRLAPEDGTVLAFWDLTHLLPRSAAVGSSVAGEVRFAGGLRVAGEPVPVAGGQARRVSVAGRLEIFEGAAAAPSDTHDLEAGDWVFVADRSDVEERRLLALRSPDAGGVHGPRRPELARHVLFERPSRAVLTPEGVLAVADAGRHRLRLVRAATRLPVLLFELGRGPFGERPDISFRGRTDGDWRGEEDLGLRLSVEPAEPGDPLELPPAVQKEILDFVGDLYENRHRLAPGPRLNEAVHVMGVARQVQRWMIHLTRTDDPEHRWGRGEGARRRLRVNLRTGSRKSYFRSANDQVSLGVDGSGAGADSWDAGVVAHEMGHWIQHHSIGFDFPYELEDEGQHFLKQLIDPNVALIEGFADYIGLFWGTESGAPDRIRGFPREGAPSLDQLATNVREPTSFRDLFSSPGLALENEGYFANALWQIHHAAVEPEILFADSSVFWHHHNQALPEARSRLFVELFRRTLRAAPSEDEQNHGSEFWLRQILERAHVLGDAGRSWLPRTVQAILELNNLLMPTLLVEPATVQVRPGETAALTARLVDAAGRDLPGHALRFEIPAVAAGSGRYRFPGPAPAPPPGGVRGRSDGEASVLVRATGPDGRVRLEVAPAGDVGTLDEGVRVSYQPDFHTDPVLAPPEAGTDRETLLRQLYLHHLRAAANDRHGAAVRTDPIPVRIRS